MWRWVAVARFDKVMVTLTLPVESYDRLLRQAFVEHRSPSAVLSDALLFFLTEPAPKGADGPSDVARCPVIPVVTVSEKSLE